MRSYLTGSFLIVRMKVRYSPNHYLLLIIDNKRPLERSRLPTFSVRPLVSSLLHIMGSLLLVQVPR